jgi:hypothetical protein
MDLLKAVTLLAGVLISLATPVGALVFIERWWGTRKQSSWIYFAKIWAAVFLTKAIAIAILAATWPKNEIIAVVALSPEVYLVPAFVHIPTVTLTDFFLTCGILSFVMSGTIAGVFVRARAV